MKLKTITQKLMKLKTIITDHNHNKYFTAQEFDKLASENFSSRLV